MAGIDLNQTLSQTQVQVLSQRQLQSLEILSLSSDDLRSSIYAEVENNPALIIAQDKTGDISYAHSKKTGPVEYTRLSSSSSEAAALASDNFQLALEAKADERESLSDHLLSQLHMMHFSPSETELGENLIYNLNDRGFHILSPVSLLNRNDRNQNENLLRKMLNVIQHMDPIGCCTSGTEESLYVQAMTKNNPPPLALLILDRHLSFLDPAQTSKVLAKVLSYQKSLREMFALSDKEASYASLKVTEEDVDKAITFIKTLDPFPARDYGSSETHYIAPDVCVEKVPLIIEEDEVSKGLISSGETVWHIRLNGDNIPDLMINPEYKKLSKDNSLTAQDKKGITEGIKKAQEFVENINQRQNTLLKACCLIVKKQHLFFEKGPGNLVPLRQSDIADEMGLHETTISRMASKKYIQTEWGLFAIKYFFVNAVDKKKQALTGDSASRDNVQFLIKQILEEHSNDTKKLSDQKICDILKERGINIARRTVAKYRSLLNISSSFDR